MAHSALSPGRRAGWHLTSLAAATLLFSASIVTAHGADEPTSAALEFFEKKIRPLLADNCFNCHSANTNSKGGLRVDDRNGLLAGGGRGPAIVPGQPDKSRLLEAVRYTNPKLKMPPEQKLSDEQIADLSTWIENGAAWPQEKLPDEIGKPKPEYDQLKREHWAWQPLKSVSPPSVGNEKWVRSDIDRFILAKLEASQLVPVGDADKLALLRRVTFDLVGLPPTLDEIDALLADESPAAFATVVDRLLASSAYGEKWGRHWLDVARYGESTGSARNLPYPHAWRYRDYVIDAFNSDKPYHQFIREQVAGDLLPANSPAQKSEQLIATGFLALGVKDVNQRFRVRFIMDNIDEQIDTLGKAVLGLTVSCARCHDHKFDPIPTTDYYALAGIFHSTDLCAGLRNKMGGGGMDYYDTSLLLQVGTATNADAPTAEKIAEAKKAFEAARDEFQAIFNKPAGKELAPNGKPKQQLARQKMNRLQAEWVALSDPAAQGQIALGVRESKTIADTEIRIRGEAEKLGPRVPRGFLSLVDIPDAPRVNAYQSGRLELAYWLTSEQNPLTPRVMVNRVWQHLFGEGLVRTVDNFGTTGDQPSHPELLDYLANRFVREGWSVKKLVKEIALSRAYQLSAENSPSQSQADPDNRLIWRHRPRRLTAEEIRDATLAATGKLNLSRPEASPAKDFKVSELRNNGAEAKRLEEQGRASVHRSVYLPLLRGITPRALEVFDFAEQGMTTGHRDATTVAPQALYLLNDAFVRRQALLLAEQLLTGDLDHAARVNLAYRRTLGRTATEVEIARAADYVSEFAAAAKETLVFAKSSGAPATETKIAAAPATGKAAAAEVNPDDIDRTEQTAKEESIVPATPEAAAWASFCQALFGCAEFRYLQ